MLSKVDFISDWDQTVDRHERMKYEKRRLIKWLEERGMKVGKWLNYTRKDLESLHMVFLVCCLDEILGIVTSDTIAMLCTSPSSIKALAILFLAVGLPAITSFFPSLGFIFPETFRIGNFIFVLFHIPTINTWAFIPAKSPISKALTVEFQASCLFAYASTFLLFPTTFNILLCHPNCLPPSYNFLFR